MNDQTHGLPRKEFVKMMEKVDCMEEYQGR